MIVFSWVSLTQKVDFDHLVNFEPFDRNQLSYIKVELRNKISTYSISIKMFQIHQRIFSVYPREIFHLRFRPHKKKKK